MDTCNANEGFHIIPKGSELCVCGRISRTLPDVGTFDAWKRLADSLPPAPAPRAAGRAAKHAPPPAAPPAPVAEAAPPASEDADAPADAAPEAEGDMPASESPKRKRSK